MSGLLTSPSKMLWERTQSTTFLSEPALTLFVARSRTELGKAMNRWIHAEVLPEIRKTGGYGKKPQYNLDWFDRLRIYRSQQRLKPKAKVLPNR